MAIRHYWPMAAAAVGFRLVLVLFGGDLHLASRPEVSTPLTSIRRLAEGYWLKQASMSPYSDFIAAMLIRATGHRLNITRNRSLNSLELTEAVSNSVNISAGDIASLIYLWNPWAIVTCVGSCTSPIENLMVVIMIYGACSRLAPLAAFGYVMSTHLTLYPAILIVPVCATTFVCSLVFIYLIISATYPYSRLLKTRFLFQIILLLGYGPDTPPAKVFRLKISSASKTEVPDNDRFSTSRDVQQFMWKPVFYFVLWMFFWSCYVLLLSSMILNKVDGLQEMFEKTYGFILTVKDLSPNIGVLWSFFLIVINMNIVFMVLPLAIRLKHRPCFLAFVYTAIVAMLKSYPSGTGNANFYFATGLAYTCIQTVLVVESKLHHRYLRMEACPVNGATAVRTGPASAPNTDSHKPKAPNTIEPSTQKALKKFGEKERRAGDESSRTLAMAGEAGGDPRAWLAVDETAAAFLSRSLSARPPILLPPPLHRAPLRPGNVVEIAGPSNSGKSQLLLTAAVQCILPKEWKGTYFGGLGKVVMYLDLDCRFDVLRLAQVLRNRIGECCGSTNPTNEEFAKDGATNSFSENTLFSECMKRFLRTLSLQSMTETVVQKLRNFLQLQPVLVMATKAPIYGEGFTGNDFQRGTSKQMLEDSTMRCIGQEEEKNISYREFMPSVWQSFVTHRIKLQDLGQEAELFSGQENKELPLRTSEWMQPSLNTKDKFSITDDGVILIH
uniref:Uncharacterized protein n=1 Tax=Oryza rufipogon TaxID=4529 RepID=A0A0E0N5M1_ORYRU